MAPHPRPGLVLKHVLYEYLPCGVNRCRALNASNAERRERREDAQRSGDARIGNLSSAVCVFLNRRARQQTRPRARVKKKELRWEMNNNVEFTIL